MSDVAFAEQLWGRAHDYVKRGDFAQAVRDLAQCFQILQAANDPRVYEVHRRWTEVHQMYLEDGARQSAAPAAAQESSVEAEAEAAANRGDLDKAIELYTEAKQRQPGNELVRERLEELTSAHARARDLVEGKSEPHAVAPGPQAHAKAEDDWSDVAVEDSRPVQSANVMKPEDAPVGMQSLDVPFSVGEAIDSFAADEMPVTGDVTKPPGNASPVAVLEDLLARIQKNKKRVA